MRMTLKQALADNTALRVRIAELEARLPPPPRQGRIDFAARDALRAEFFTENPNKRSVTPKELAEWQVARATH